MTRAKRPVLASIISLLLLVIAAVTIWRLPPSHVLLEMGVITTLGAGLWLAASWVIGLRKWATLLVSFLIVTLLLNRLQILSPVTLGLWIATIGLISLIN